MRAITPSKFETTGNDANENEKHVNDIRIYSTSVLHATDDGECIPVNTKEIAVSEGKEAAAHVVQAVVNTQRGELQFNSVRGIPYLETIFSHPDRLMEWETEMREAIESLPFVTSIESFETFVERMNAPHRDTQLQVSYKSSIRTTFDDGEEVDLNDGRTIRLHTFPIAPKSNWEFQTDPDSTDFIVDAEVGSFILIHITCDRGTTISWDDDDKTAFSVVGETVTAVSHTYEKAGKFKVRLGSGIKRFTIEKNSIVTEVTRFSNTITDLSYAFKDNTGLTDVCEWADQITNVSYCYCGCTNLKGVKQSDGRYTIPQFTDSIDYCLSTYEGCGSLVPLSEEESIRETDEDYQAKKDARDAKYMPPRIHDLGFFYNCYYNTSEKLRNITLQSWGGNVIDFSDDRYATDLKIKEVAGGVEFRVETNLESQYMTYSLSEYTISGVTSLNYKGIGVPSGTPQNGWWYKKLGKCFVYGDSKWNEVQSYTLTSVAADMANKPIGGYYVSGTNVKVTYVASSDFKRVPIAAGKKYDSTPITIPKADISDKRVKFSLGVRRIRCMTEISVTSVNAYSSLITNLEDMFRGVTSLTNACAFSAAAKNVTNTFNGCTSLQSVGGFLGGAFWKNINELKGCFCGCSSLTCGTTDDSVIPSFPAVVSDVRQCYKGCASLKGITPSLANSVAKADECFMGCTLVGMYQKKISWGISLITASYCYQGCATLGQTQGADFVLPVWDDVAVRDASHCFEGCTSLSCLLPLPPQNRILRLAGCFKGCLNLQSIAVGKDTDGLYKYDKTLMPIAFRGTDTTAAFSDDEVTTPVATKNGYVEDCSTTIRSLYIQTWGGTRPNSDDAALEGSDYTEIFINTTDRTGQKISEIALGLAFDVSEKLFYVTGLDAYPRAFVSHAGYKRENNYDTFDPTQTFGTSASTGVSTSVIRIVTRKFVNKGNVDTTANLPTSGNKDGDVWHVNADGSNYEWNGTRWRICQDLAALTAFHLPSVARSYDFTLTNRGSSAPSTPSDGDYYISNGRTYLYKGEDIIEFPFAIAQKASGSIATSAQYNGDVGKYIISGGGTVLGDMGDMTYAIVNLNKVADTVTNMQNSFIYAEGLENTCAWPTALTDCASCYQFCTALLGLTEGSIPAWPSGVVSLFKCYYGCTSLLSMGMEKLHDFPAGATDAQYCYCNCTSITAMPGEWGGVTNASHCYDGCTSLGSAQSGGELPYWGNVTDASYCYRNCSALDAVMPVWFSDSEQNVVVLGNVQYCFYGCTALNANPYFDNYIEAHRKELGGFSGSDTNDYHETAEQQKARHFNCVANTNEEISKQFGSEWGGNFQFAPLIISVDTKKKVSGSLKFYVSINDLDTGTDAYVDYVVGKKYVAYDESLDNLSVRELMKDSDASNNDDSSGYDEQADAQKLSILQRIVSENIDHVIKKEAMSCTATFQRVVIQGDFKIFNVDVLGLDTSTRRNENWNRSNSVFGSSATKKTATKFPYIVSVEDSKNGCCVAFLDRTFASQKRLESVSCNHLMVVGNYCFYNCKSLKEVDLPSVEYCGDYAFSKCINLESINLEKCVGLGTGIFDECKKLATLRLNTIDVIRPYMLSKLANLEELEVATDGTACVINSEGISEIGRKATTSLYFGSDVYFRTCALGYNKSYVQNIYCDIGIDGFKQTLLFYQGSMKEIDNQLTRVAEVGERSSIGDYTVNTSLTHNEETYNIAGEMTAKNSISEVIEDGDYYFGTSMYRGFCVINGNLVGLEYNFHQVASESLLSKDGDYYDNGSSVILYVGGDKTSFSHAEFAPKSLADLYSTDRLDGWHWGTDNTWSCVKSDTGSNSIVPSTMRSRDWTDSIADVGDFKNINNCMVVKNSASSLLKVDGAVPNSIQLKDSDGNQLYLFVRTGSSSSNIIKTINNAPTHLSLSVDSITDKNTKYIYVSPKGEVFYNGAWQKFTLGTHSTAEEGSDFANSSIPQENVGGYVFVNEDRKIKETYRVGALGNSDFSNLLKKVNYDTVTSGTGVDGMYSVPKFIQIMTKTDGIKYVDWDLISVNGITANTKTPSPTLPSIGDYACYISVCTKITRSSTTAVEGTRQIYHSHWGVKGDFYVDSNRTIHLWNKQAGYNADTIVELKTKYTGTYDKRDFVEVGDYFVHSARIRTSDNAVHELGDVLCPSNTLEREGNFIERNGVAFCKLSASAPVLIHGTMTRFSNVSDLTITGRYVECPNVSLLRVSENNVMYLEGLFASEGSSTVLIQSNSGKSNAVSYKAMTLHSDNPDTKGYYSVSSNTTTLQISDSPADKITFPFVFHQKGSVSLLDAEGDFVNTEYEAIIRTNFGNENGNLIIVKKKLEQAEYRQLVTSEGKYYPIDSDSIGTSIESAQVFQQIESHFDSGCFYGIINGASAKINVDISLAGVYLFRVNDEGNQIQPYSNTRELITRIFAKVRRRGGSSGYSYLIDTKKGIGNNSKYIRIIDGSNNMMTAYQIARKNSATTWTSITDSTI